MRPARLMVEAHRIGAQQHTSRVSKGTEIQSRRPNRHNPIMHIIIIISLKYIAVRMLYGYLFYHRHHHRDDRAMIFSHPHFDLSF